MIEHELRAKANRADHAERLLKDTLLREAIDGMKATVFKNIETSHFSKTEEREDLYKMLKAINGFEGELKRWVRDGIKSKTLLEKLFTKGK